MLNLAALPRPGHPHDTELTGVLGSAPTLVKLPAEDYLPLLFADLRAPDWRARILARSPAASPNLRLFLPIHRSFQVVLLDARCQRFGRLPRDPDANVERLGTPRLDPKKIASMGLVIRRLRDDGDESGWMRQGELALGWRRLVERTSDPDPKRRVSAAKFGPADLQQRLAAKRAFDVGDPSRWEETVAPLFVAPPEVCAATGCTLLYGLIPVSSGEREAVNGRDIDAAAFAANVSVWLGPDAPALPNAGDTLTAESFYKASTDGPLGSFFQLLMQVKFEFQVFGGSNSELHRLLNESRVALANDATQALGDWLRRAVDLFDPASDRTTQPQSLVMPLAWPVLDAAFRARFTAVALANALRRLADERGKGSLPNAARFESARAHYRLRAFIRVQETDACPPRLVWSAASPDFGLVPWFEPGDAAPAAIALPGLEDFSKLKPNVAFAVPKSLQGFLQANDAKGLLDGDKKKSTIGVAWICSFSLPIITLCAFIVLNIFLKLFDLIFNWLAFIKICIPLPVPNKDE